MKSRTSTSGKNSKPLNSQACTKRMTASGRKETSKVIRNSLFERPLSGKAAIGLSARCSLTMRCTRHLTQPALRCRSGWSASSAC